MNKNLYKHLIIAVATTAIIAGPCGYLLGTKSQASGKAASQNGGNYQRQGMQRTGASGMNATGTAGAARRMTRGGMTIGEVIGVDESGLTVKMVDGGSRRVLLPATIAVSGCEEFDKSAIVEGKFVMVSGDTNTDNSITARNVQVMSKMPTVMPFRGGTTDGAAPTDGATTKTRTGSGDAVFIGGPEGAPMPPPGM